MKTTDAVSLCRAVKAYCPSQAMDEFTPDAWFDILEDLELADCLEAVKAIVRRQPFVAPGEVRTEVFRIRKDRVDRAGVLTVPREIEAIRDADEFDRRYRAWLGQAKARIANGEPVELVAPKRLASPASASTIARAISASKGGKRNDTEDVA